VTLSGASIAENLPAGTAVGTLTTTDQDAGDTFGYALVAGTGDADNGVFEIAGNVLKSKSVFDYESQSSYTIRVRSTDAGGLFTEQVFTVTVTDVSDGPTDVSLSSAVIAENRPVGTAVGTLSSTDQDAVDTFAYTLVAGAGSTDNGSFEIAGSVLKTKAAFNYESQSSYSVRVRSTDAGGLFTEKQLTVTVTDVNEAPTAVGLVNVPASILENTSTSSRVKVADIAVTDDALGTNTITLSGADAASFEVVGTGLYLKAGTTLDYGLKPSYDIVVDAFDASASDTLPLTPLTAFYRRSSGGLTLRNTTSSALSLTSVSILSPQQALSGVAATLPTASFTVSNTSTEGLYGVHSEIFFGNVGSTVLTLPAGGGWSLGDVARTGLTPTELAAAFVTDSDADPQGVPAVGQFVYSGADGTAYRGSIVADVSSAATIRIGNVPEHSGREYAEVPAGSTVVDTTPRTGNRQVIVRGGGTLVLAGANTHTGGVKVEGGTLVVRNAAAFGTGVLDVRSGGVVTLDVGFSKAKVSSLSLASGARINLGTGGLEIAAGGTTLADLRSAILSARSGGTWNGTGGIGSANVDLSKSRVVGYRQVPATGAFQVAWAAFGDTNLDGRVNSTDVQSINSGRKFGQPARDSHWSQGDFSYDGRVNSTDVLQLSAQFGKPSYFTAGSTAASTSLGTPPAALVAQLFAAFEADPDADDDEA